MSKSGSAQRLQWYNDVETLDLKRVRYRKRRVPETIDVPDTLPPLAETVRNKPVRARLHGPIRAKVLAKENCT
jgi:hypothetical protein